MLGLVQPGISRQLHDFVDEIGFSLFVRRGKTVGLTVAGEIFSREARDIPIDAFWGSQTAATELLPRGL